MTSKPALGRHRERGLPEREQLYSIIDAEPMATLSTVHQGQPLVVPTLVVREGDRLLMHGSSAAGAMRVAAAGAPVAVSVSILDGIVVADRLFNHSANYRSAVVYGTATELTGDDERRALDVFSDGLLPGRSDEVDTHSTKEVAATLTIALDIGVDNWVAKARAGGPAGDPSADRWTGVVHRTTSWGPADRAPGAAAEVPESVGRRLWGGN